VKLDISLIQRWPEVEQGAILTAVSPTPKRTGALILAEGVETERHLEQALALGRPLGQVGTLRGRVPSKTSRHPQNLSSNLDRCVQFRVLHSRAGFFGDTHWPKGPSSRHFTTPGEQGLYLETPPVVVSAFQSAERFTPDTAKRYSRLAERCPLVAALGRRSKSRTSARRSRSGTLPDDPVSGEWVVA